MFSYLTSKRSKDFIHAKFYQSVLHTILQTRQYHGTPKMKAYNHTHPKYLQTVIRCIRNHIQDVGSKSKVSKQNHIQ
uniref:Uncharacterized protein n=1 Tax=Rhizophora mucronata TaxID=61149 RepID=A0A2P2N5U9_RHIMU